MDEMVPLAHFKSLRVNIPGFALPVFVVVCTREATT